MKSDYLPRYSRVLLGVCAALLIVLLFFPFWQIQLTAPQYPEGLVLLIYANKLAGNVDIINGLNHYIGMKTLHTEDFFEFDVLPYIIIFFALFTALVAIKGKRRWLYVLFTVFILFGIFSMIDFWKWNYNYGHNLDPNAAIVVPGMAYQPPILGYKQLLNFGAYSIPDIGGMLFIGVGLVLLVLVVLAARKQAKGATGLVKMMTYLLLGAFMWSLVACSHKPQPLVIGKDNCSFCKMPYNDNRFGGELLTENGKVFKFDDVHCMLSFINEGTELKGKSYELYFVNFLADHQLVPMQKALFYTSPAFRTPMNGNVVIFDNKDSLEANIRAYPGNVEIWENLMKM